MPAVHLVTGLFTQTTLDTSHHEHWDPSYERGGPTTSYRWTKKQLSLRNNRQKLKHFRKFNHHFRGISGIHLKLVKKVKDHNMYLVGLGNTRSFTEYAEKSPWNAGSHLVSLYDINNMGSRSTTYTSILQGHPICHFFNHVFFFCAYMKILFRNNIDYATNPPMLRRYHQNQATIMVLTFTLVVCKSLWLWLMVGLIFHITIYHRFRFGIREAFKWLLCSLTLDGNVKINVSSTFS